jgi:hypothetical protein
MMERIESRRVSRLIGGALLLFVGVLFLLQNLGWLDAGRLWDWWPLVLVWIGLSRMFAPIRPRHLPSGAVVFALGVFLQLERLDVVRIDAHDVWPILLVVAGAALIADSWMARRPPAGLRSGENLAPGTRP